MNRSLYVTGKPIPQGSTKAFAVKGKAFTTSTNAGPLARYRNDIRNIWTTSPKKGERLEPDPVDGEVVMVIDFTFARPKSHYLPANSKRKERELREDAPAYVIGKPDLDKLIRAVGDALTGYAYKDDAQVVQVVAHKRWGEAARTHITVSS